MPQQLPLPGLAARPTDRLFFALRPDQAASAQIIAITDGLYVAHGLSGRRLKAGNLHVSLHHIGDFAGLPNEPLLRARAAGEILRHGPVTIRFDRAGSFVRQHRTLPLVLRGSGQVIPLIAFQHELGQALGRQGLRAMASTSYTPHMTLLYDPRYVEAKAVTPVEWTATEFVLIRSLIGKSRHEVLGRWSLDAD
ncbi:MAG: 2'-5' RNA ligase family protein [Alphaproteobacteria bacterium]|nr:2'-5' RNA ligase family protein [Alphaproteobacteria bacterium]